MEKNILIVLVLMMVQFGCSFEQKKSNSKEQNVEKVSMNYSKQEGRNELNLGLNSSGKREYRDSANFQIVRRWYVSGSKFIEVYGNRDTKIDSWKEYYSTGNLKEEGLMTSSNHHYIGVWKYYSENGALDSLVNYDKKQTVSYYKALKISTKYGYTMPDIEITKTNEKGKMYWQVNRWTEIEGGKSAETILIDSKTGEVSKPKNQLFMIY